MFLSWEEKGTVCSATLSLSLYLSLMCLDTHLELHTIKQGWGTSVVTNRFARYNPLSKEMNIQRRGTSPYKCIRRGNIKEQEIHPTSSDTPAFPPTSGDSTVPSPTPTSGDSSVPSPTSTESAEGSCAGMLTETNPSVPSSSVREAATGDVVERYVQECQCLASKNELSSIACDETDEEWKTKAGSVSADMLSGAESDVENFASLSPPAKAAIVHLRIERGSLPSDEWPSLLSALQASDMAAASRELFTRSSLMKEGCQRWKWMSDAAKCDAPRFLRGGSSVVLNEGSSLLMQN